MTTVSEPLTLTGIKVSPTNPQNTILSIQSAFQQAYQNVEVSPYDSAAMPATDPVVIRGEVPTVSVTSVPTASDPSGLLAFQL